MLVALFRQVYLFRLLIDSKVPGAILFLYTHQLWHQGIDSRIAFRAVFRRTGYNQWSTGLVD